MIGPDVALRLAASELAPSDSHRLLAPTLLRSQVVSQLYAAARRGELSERDAAEQLDRIRGLRLRLLGDRVLQRTVWKLAQQLDGADTAQAEYVALTRLQADALVTLAEALARSVEGVVPVAPFEALLDRP